MDSAVNTRQAEPHVNPALSTQEIELVARADQRLAHAYEQIARADEELARFNDQISRLEKKPANRLRQPSRGRPALRGLMGLLLTAGIFTAAFVWQSYGETVRPMISRWVPQLAAASSLPSETPKLADPQSPPAVQVAAADAAVSQSPPLAQTAPQDAAAAEQTQLLQTMARDLASAQQEIEQLKASQAELARESARTSEQLKANQEQMARVIADVSEQNLRPKIPVRTSAAASAARSAATSASPPRPVATPARKPASTAPATQARAQARAPMQLQSRQQ